MTWEDALKAIAPRARKAETIEQAARATFDLARSLSTVGERIAVKLAWHNIRNRANDSVMPPWLGLLDGIDPGDRLEALASAAEDAKLRDSALYLVTIYARFEDRERLIALAKTHGSGAILARVAEISPDGPARLDREFDALWRSRRAKDVDLALQLVRTPAGALRLADHVETIVRLVLAADPRRRVDLLRRLGAFPATPTARDALLAVVARLEGEGAIDDETIDAARALLADHRLV